MEITINRKDYIVHVNKLNELELMGSVGLVKVDEGVNQIVSPTGKRRPVQPEKVRAMQSYREGLRSELKEYYCRLLAGVELLMLIPTNDPTDYPHIITSQTLLDRGHESVKFAEVLESVFLSKSMERIGVNHWNHSLHDVQARSKDIKVHEITLRNLTKEMM